MKRIIFILLICVVCGCKNRQTPSDTIFIDLDIEPNEIQSSSLIKGYDLIELETVEQGLIGRIDKVIKHGDYIYVADYRRTRSVTVFNSDGRFVNNINKFGRGPGEYTEIQSVFVDKYDNTLNILNRMPAKILKFPLDGSGNPQIVDLGKMLLSEIIPVKDGYVAYAGNCSFDNKSKNIWFLDRQGNINGSQFDIPQGWESNDFLDVRVLSEYGDRVSYMSFVGYDFYSKSVEEELFKRNFRADFGHYSWPEEIRSASDYFEIKDVDFVNKIYSSQEIDDYWIFHFFFKGEGRIALYDKNRGKSTVYSLGPYEDKYFLSFGQIHNITDEYIITSIDASRVKRIWNGKDSHGNDFEAEYPDQVRRLRADFPDIDEDGNPFLAIYRLR